MNQGKKSRKGANEEAARSQGNAADPKGKRPVGENDERYFHIFNSAGVTIWEEDYSELKAALAALKQSGVTDFRTYIDEHPEFLERAAGMVRVVDVNEATLALYEAPSKAAILSSIDQVFTPESYVTFKELLIAIAAGENSFEAETVNKTLSGKPINILLKAVIPGDESPFKNLLINIIDITERKRMQEALVRSEKRFRSLFETMNEGFALHEIICDKGGRAVDYRFLVVNPAFERLTGLKGETVTGRTAREVLPGLERHWIDKYGRVALEGKAEQFEYFAQDLGRHYDITAFSPEPGKFAVIVSDATERRMLKDELLKAKKLESLGFLAGGIAHDFNSLLTSILGNLSLIRLLIDPTHQAAQRLEECENSTLKASELVKQLLTFARSGEPTKKAVGMPLPATHAAGQKSEPAKNAETADGRRVLVMDDEESIRELSVAILGFAGFRVETCRDGAEAVAKYRCALSSGSPYDAVIMDLTIPRGMGAAEAAVRILEIDPAANLVVSSGYATDPVIANYREYGFKGAVVKPFRVEDLRDELQKLFAAKSRN